MSNYVTYALPARSGINNPLRTQSFSCASFELSFLVLSATLGSGLHWHGTRAAALAAASRLLSYCQHPTVPTPAHNYKFLALTAPKNRGPFRSRCNTRSTEKKNEKKKKKLTQTHGREGSNPLIWRPTAVNSALIIVLLLYSTCGTCAVKRYVMTTAYCCCKLYIAQAPINPLTHPEKKTKKTHKNREERAQTRPSGVLLL